MRLTVLQASFRLLVGGAAFFLAATAQGQLDVLHSFDGTDGETLEGSLTLLGNTLYGFTAMGGANDGGVLFSIGDDGSDFDPYYSFTDAGGEQPHHGSLLYDNGLFYATTYLGGAGGGMIYSITPGGTNFTPLYTFQQSTGWQPHNQLTLGSDGLLYGITSLGGAGNVGTAFSFNPTTQTYTDLYDFTGGTAAAVSHSHPVFDSTGTELLGMSRAGGQFGQGTVFSINLTAPPGSTYTTLLSLNNSDPASPGFDKHGSLELIGSTIYGVTQLGGAYGKGALFSMNENGGDVVIMHSFGDPAVPDDGVGPYGSLLLLNGEFYGTTFNGGSGGNGTVFEIGENGAGYDVLASFDGVTGINPRDDLTPNAAGTMLYGTTSAGGAFDPDGSLAYGTVFAIAIPEPAAWAWAVGVVAGVGMCVRRKIISEGSVKRIRADGPKARPYLQD
jgi:uncharacterized repeat protein (TIGR03803 family)